MRAAPAAVLLLGGLVALGGCAGRRVQVMPPAAALAAMAGARTDVERLAQDGHDRRFEALTALLKERGLAFAIEPFSAGPSKNDPRTAGRNIVITLPGPMPALIVGAHYDAVRMRDGTYSRGAVDNGASAIMLVRLAEALRGVRLRRQVRIVLFDMEENGLIGSERYVAAHGSGEVAAMVNLDVNAFGDTSIYGPSNEANGTARRRLAAFCTEAGHRCVDLPVMPPSDDRSFTAAGIAALSIATVPAREAHQLWLLMNAGKGQSGLAEGFLPDVLRTIHAPADQPSLVDERAMAGTFRVLLPLVTALAREPRQ